MTPGERAAVPRLSGFLAARVSAPQVGITPLCVAFNGSALHAWIEPGQPGTSTVWWDDDVGDYVLDLFGAGALTFLFLALAPQRFDAIEYVSLRLDAGPLTHTVPAGTGYRALVLGRLYHHAASPTWKLHALAQGFHEYQLPTLLPQLRGFL